MRVLQHVHTQNKGEQELGWGGGGGGGGGGGEQGREKGKDSGANKEMERSQGDTHMGIYQYKHTHLVLLKE